jgi:hypothetical protein
MREQDIQTKIMRMLQQHPNVAFAYVTSTGTFKGMSGGRPIKIGFPGLADIIGMMRDGRLFAIEVKMPKKKPTQDQLDFLEMVSDNGGIGIWVDNVDSVDYVLSN